MLRFLSIGSGSSGNCYLLTDGDCGLMIDAGVGPRTIKKTLKERGFSLAQVDAILVSHDHTDHIKSLGHIANDANIPVYTTQRVHEGIQKSYCMTTKLNKECVHFIEKGETKQIGTFMVTPFEVPHDSTDNVGYKIVDSNGAVFCLMTDIGHVTPVIEQHIAEANYLVIEANFDAAMLKMGPYPQYLKDRIAGLNGHLSNKETAAALVKKYHDGLKHVWLCHLSEENNHPELCRKTIETELLNAGIYPDSSMKFEVLKRKVPSEIFELL